MVKKGTTKNLRYYTAVLTVNDLIRYSKWKKYFLQN